MKGYSIGEACEMLEIKPHVLRYWEQEIPYISPQKDDSGRRIYTNREMQILKRLKYLLYQKRFTIEGAREQLFQELTKQDTERGVVLQNIRDELKRLLAISRRTHRYF